jgi:hypothetical protein
MQAIDTDLARTSWDAKRSVGPTRLPTWATIPLIATASAGMWLLAFRIAGGLIAYLH